MSGESKPKYGLLLKGICVLLLIAIALFLLMFGINANTSKTSTTTMSQAAIIPPPVSGSGNASIGSPYYYASAAWKGNISIAPSSGMFFLCEASASCSNGIQNYSWVQDVSDAWCDTYYHCGQFDSVGHQTSSVCALGPVTCPRSTSQPVVIGAIGLKTSLSYSLYKSVSSPLSYNVTNSTKFVIIMVSCAQSGTSSCSTPSVPSGCFKLFWTIYGNETGFTLGPSSVYGAICSSQSPGTYTVSVQRYAYYTAAAYVYHG